MSDKFPPTLQRPRLLVLADALDISLTQLRRDDCGDWMLKGRFGHIYAVFDSYQIMLMGWDESGDAPWTTARGWNNCKRALVFLELTLDGDMEGAFLLDHDPIPDEAEQIRHWVGLRKRMALSEVTLAALRERGKTLAGLREG